MTDAGSQEMEQRFTHATAQLARTLQLSYGTARPDIFEQGVQTTQGPDTPHRTL